MSELIRGSHFAILSCTLLLSILTEEDLSHLPQGPARPEYCEQMTSMCGDQTEIGHCESCD